jgi:hypothetical protein
VPLTDQEKEIRTEALRGLNAPAARHGGTAVPAATGHAPGYHR